MNTAQKFILANLVWIDILAPLATGTIPQLPYHDWLNTGKIDMSRVMGCQNSIMIAIGDLMALEARASSMSTESLQAGIFSLDKRILNAVNTVHNAQSEVCA